MQPLKSMVLSGILALTISAPAAYAQEHKWTLAYLALPGTPYQDLVDAIPARIASATDGAVMITPNASLVAGNRLLEGVRDGLVQITIPLTGYYTATEPLFAVPSLPGYSDSYDQLKALNKSAYGDRMRTLYTEQYNSVELMETAFCPQVLFSTVPITTREEWNERKLRVNNRVMGLIAGQVGASPISLSAGEIVPALEQGVIEGVITDTCWALGAGLSTVIKHAAGWKLGTVFPMPVLANKDALDKLSKDVRAKLMAEFDAIEIEFEQKWKDRIGGIPQKWRDAGVDYHEITDAENAKMLAEDVMTPVLEAWHSDMKRKGRKGKAVLESTRMATE